jgi:hypothetical protein
MCAVLLCFAGTRFPRQYFIRIPRADNTFAAMKTLLGMLLLAAAANCALCMSVQSVQTPPANGLGATLSGNADGDE